MRLYNSPISGNSYKIRLLLSHLALPYEQIDLDINAGAAQTPEMLARNPMGRVPLLELDDGTLIAESGAILCYLAEGSDYLPSDRLGRAQVLRWVFFEQNEHEPNIAVARWLARWGGGAGARPDLPDRMQRGQRALGAMEQHLQTHRFFGAPTLSIGDIALYGYTHVAGEGGFDLDRTPAIGQWLARVADHPRHIRM